MNIKRIGIKIFLLFGMFFSGSLSTLFFFGCVWQASEIYLNSTTLTADQFGWPVLWSLLACQSVNLFVHLLDDWKQKKRRKII